jgi:GGDEF domain-containing protein
MQEQTIKQLHPINKELSLYWLGEFTPSDWYPDFSIIKHTDAIPKELTTPILIVVSLHGKVQDEALQAIRANEATALSMVLVCHQSELSDSLANGLWQDDFEILTKKYLLKSKQVNLDFSNDIAYKLLCYLWIHSTQLKPQLVPFEKHLYEYPLLCAWGINAQDSFTWLLSVKRKGWLVAEKLINRVRFCANCSSGHLNYVDICPQCASIEIEAQSSLHCFNCGHVGKQDDFKKLAMLECPNCLQSLRHIGVDYDRPIENMHCRSCDNLFNEGAVQANCLHCQSHNQIDDLHVRNISTYTLSDVGGRLVRKGNSQFLFDWSSGENMSTEQFSWLINWQNKLALRHQQSHLIIAIEVLNLQSTIKQAGEIMTFLQLDALKERLKSVIRETDISCSLSQNTLLLFLPSTHIEHAGPIYMKLKEKLQLQFSSRLDIQIKALSLPAQKMAIDTLVWIMNKLSTVKPL